MMNFSALLLTGGKSTRMGQDKASLQFGGRMLWEHQIDVLRLAGADEILISGHAQGVYASSTYSIIADEYLNCGPIAGLHAGLKKAQHAHLLLLAIDLPRMTPDYLRSLRCKCPEGCGAVGVDKAYEPLAAFYPRALLPLLEVRIRAGRYGFQELIADAESQGCMISCPINQEDLPLFFNWNSGLMEKEGRL